MGCARDRRAMGFKKRAGRVGTAFFCFSVWAEDLFTSRVGSKLCKASLRGPHISRHR